MSLLNKFRVPIPDKGVIVRKNPKRPYVEKVVATCRNAKGQPTCKTIVIGKRDGDTNTMIPNGRYWEFYDSASCPYPIVSVDMFDSIKEIGAAFVLNCLLESTGTIGALRTAFGDTTTDEIVKVAEYMAINGNIMSRLGTWCGDCLLGEGVITSQYSTTLFESITYVKRMSFFKSFIGVLGVSGYVAYDVTSFSTYAASNSDAEMGYNRDGEDLPQINLGCYFSEERELPIFYTAYPGSITDKSHLSFMTARNDELGVKDAKFVMDAGFASEANLKYMKGRGMRYLIRVEKRVKTVKTAIGNVIATIRQLRYRIDQNTYATTTKGTFYGVEATLHIYFNAHLAERERDVFARSIEKEELRLAGMKEITKEDAKKMRKWFDIEERENRSFTFSRNLEKIDKVAETHGFFCLLTNIETTAKEALAVYRRKDVVEKAFDDIKNEAEMKRLRTHNRKTTEGKLFCAFISLIALSELLNKCRELMKSSACSRADIFESLNKIRIVKLADGHKLINPITKLQRDILSACGISEVTLNEYLVKG